MNPSPRSKREHLFVLCYSEKMGTWERTYCCIDLKSFYASVECADAGWDPFEKLLVVADESRGEKTICLAVSPALKALGVPGRCRVFELPKGLKIHKARPRMRRYMEVSGQILAVYLRYVSAADLHVYSIDECFIDLTPYLALYKMDAKAFVNMLRDEVMEATGVTATAGIGPNLFLAKVALDVTAKHTQDGIGVLDREAFRQIIWPHRPITDIWQIGPGIAARLQKYGIRDLGGVAHADIDLLYKVFGVNAEYLIDHAWGLEPCTIAQIKAYEPESTSFGNGQVLPFDYSFEEGRMILREMVDEAVLDLVDKRVVTDHVHLHVGYRKDTSTPGARSSISVSHQLSGFTNSFEKLLAEFDQLYCERVDPARPVRRLNISFGHLEPEEFATYDLFTDVEAQEEERARQDALIEIKKKFGKSAVMRGTSYKEKARGLERAEQVGGHHE